MFYLRKYKCIQVHHKDEFLDMIVTSSTEHINRDIRVSEQYSARINMALKSTKKKKEL